MEQFLYYLHNQLETTPQKDKVSGLNKKKFINTYIFFEKLR